VVLTDTGTVTAAAVRVQHPAKRFRLRGSGTRHGAALGLAEWLAVEGDGGVVFLRSDSGAIKILVARNLIDHGIIHTVAGKDDGDPYTSLEQPDAVMSSTGRELAPSPWHWTIRSFRSVRSSRSLRSFRSRWERVLALLTEGGSFPHHKYIIGEKIGAGTFGQVRKLRQRGQCPHCRAVKIINLSLIGGSGCLDRKRLAAARQEHSIWRHLGKHTHCVRLFEVFMEDLMHFAVMELLECSLMDNLEKFPKMCETAIAHMLRDMLLGLEYVHGRRVVHRDIKPSNFLICTLGERAVVKLGDFGMAAKLPRHGGKLTGCYGTAPYMSPEMCASWGHDQSTDIWSFGATAYVLLCGNFPYLPTEMNSKAMKLAILSGACRPTFTRPRGCQKASKQLEAFLPRLLERSPARRCTAELALRLPLCKETQEDACAWTEQLFRRSEAVEGEVASARSGSSTIRRACAEAPFRPAEATQASTVQKTLDELLESLKHRGQSVLHRSFSEPDMRAMCTEEREEDEECMQGLPRGRTHAGVI